MKAAARLVIVTALALSAAGAWAADANKVLHLAFPDISGLDPQQIGDLSSVRIAQQIFEGLYEYSYLADPCGSLPTRRRRCPRLATTADAGQSACEKAFGSPMILRSGDIRANSSPTTTSTRSSAGSTRNLKAGGDVALTDLIVGARPLVDAARKPGGHFDYDAPIAGLRAVDRHTLEIRIATVDYTLLERLASWRALAVAREVVEARGADPSAAPVGTGPYRLKEWKRGSRIVLRRIRPTVRSRFQKTSIRPTPGSRA